MTGYTQMIFKASGSVLFNLLAGTSRVFSSCEAHAVVVFFALVCRSKEGHTAQEACTCHY